MTSEAKAVTRRTEGVRSRGRAARVVSEVLRATAEELSRVGYGALRVEDVAARSGVNKTTIYRRWPTKPELVAAALRNVKELPDVPDTGSLRSDLLESLRSTVAFATSPIGRGLVNMMQTERAHPEVEPIAKALREEHRKTRDKMVARAVARGELPAMTNPRLIADVVSAAILSRLISYGEPVDDAFIGSVIDLVLAGARSNLGSGSFG
jgi:AcrR family transcriptional regulator